MVKFALDINTESFQDCYDCYDWLIRSAVILKNVENCYDWGHVPCHYFLNVPVDFKVVQCRLSNLRKCHVGLLKLRVKALCGQLWARGP